MCALSACPRVHTSLVYLVAVATARGVRARVLRARLRTRQMMTSKAVGRAVSRRGHEWCRNDGRTQPSAACRHAVDKDKDKDIRTLHAHSRLPVAPPAVPRPVCPPDAPYSLTACAPLEPGWALPHGGQSRMAGRGEIEGGEHTHPDSRDARRLATPLMRDTPLPQHTPRDKSLRQTENSYLYGAWRV